MFGRAGLLTRQRGTADITAKPGDQRRVAPAWPTQGKIILNQITTNCAAGRVNQMQSRLNPPQLHSIVRAMTHPLIDRPALARQRLRAQRDFAAFLHEQAIDEIKDRLSIVNKSFTQAAVVSGAPHIWHSAFMDATHVSDDDTLDLAEGTHDLVIHGLALHWANDLLGQLIQARRALKPDGLFMAALFGGTTLHQLRAALAQAESDLYGGLSPRVAPMGEIRDLGGLLQRAGFALPVADSLPLSVSYETPLHLMRDLRAMGEANVLSDRPRSPMPKALLTRACEIYEDTYADKDGRILATFDMVFLIGWAPAPDQPQPLRPGSASTRLADVLGAKETPLKD